ncbi:hypothetical protein ET475_00300 [Microbacterium protaetiae]|uniref:Uncharacterized protein n=1 Tax=Microbacterium protaetiae TaxID=2509458 RepID=A0A4P6EBE0_9MICO|nr:hypothetical protein [Microbacterium protaetiae]QAY58593.1 hypothetical protein ET475_00300 [Microbacterium protaetiae]
MRDVFHVRTPLTPGTDSLLPLSALCTLDPDAYARAMAKYDDTPERRRLRDTVVPLIERAWTEVVFLSPVHPHATWRAWRELSGRALPSVEFWAIPASDLPDDTVVFDRQRSLVGDPIDPRDVASFDLVTYEASLEVPHANREWLGNLVAAGHSGAWFNLIPHVLTAGPVPLTNARVISWVVEPQLG